MTPLLCLPPKLLDQSFPRDIDALQTVARSLGELESCISAKEARLISTPVLGSLIEMLDWSNRTSDAVPVLMIIRNFLLQLMMSPAVTLIDVETECATNQPHPIPVGDDNGDLVAYWAQEVGRLLGLHDQCVQSNRCCIGIACGQSFDSSATTAYPVGTIRAFPIVGRTDIPLVLESAFEWRAPPNAHNITISFDDIRRNFGAIGGTRFEEAVGDSHCRVYFPRNRFWTCDRNWGTNIGPNILFELKDFTGWPLPAIKYALKTGKHPQEVCRLCR